MRKAKGKSRDQAFQKNKVPTTHREVLEMRVGVTETEDEANRVFEYWCSCKDDDVTDEAFLRFIEVDHNFLFFPFAQQKIGRWIKEKHDPDRKISQKAQRNLRNIGVSLAYKGHRKDGTSMVAVACRYGQLLSELKGISTSKNRGDMEMWNKIERLYGNLSIKRIALKIVADEYERSTETVKTYIKRLKRQYKDLPPKKPQ